MVIWIVWIVSAVTELRVLGVVLAGAEVEVIEVVFASTVFDCKLQIIATGIVFAVAVVGIVWVVLACAAPIICQAITVGIFPLDVIVVFTATEFWVAWVVRACAVVMIIGMVLTGAVFSVNTITAATESCIVWIV